MGSEMCIRDRHGTDHDLARDLDDLDPHICCSEMFLGKDARQEGKGGRASSNETVEEYRTSDR